MMWMWVVWLERLAALLWLVVRRRNARRAVPSARRALASRP